MALSMNGPKEEVSLAERKHTNKVKECFSVVCFFLQILYNHADLWYDNENGEKTHAD